MTAADISLPASSGHPAALRLLLPVAAVLSALALPVVAVLLHSYDYQHGWVSAHFATMARSFMENGIFALGGVPVQNNAPLTLLPDAYVNWPPLYPMLLSIVFRIFGDAEIVQHLFATSINLALGGLLTAFTYRRFGTTAASIAAIAFFNAPILARFGHMGSQLHLAILLCLASLWLFAAAIGQDEGRAGRARLIGAAGCFVFAASVLSSWEPVLAVPGLFAVAVFTRDMRGALLSIAYGACGFLAICAVFGMYWAQYDYFGDAIIQRIMLRAGFDAAYDPAATAIFNSPHFIQETHEPLGTPGLSYWKRIFMSDILAQGLLGFLGIFLIFKLPVWRRRDPLAYVAAGSIAIYVLWAVLMRHHMAIHVYELLLLTPIASICGGALVAHYLGSDSAVAPGRLMLASLAVILIAAGTKVPYTLKLLGNENPEQSAEIQFALQIRNTTEPGSIVAHADRSMVPVYYSRRHIIRSVWDEATLAENRTRIEALCTDCPVYLAIPDQYLSRFAGFTSKNKPILESGEGAIYRLR